MQKAWFYEEYGPKEVLRLGNFPLPTLRHNQLLVQVWAASLNPSDFKRRQNPIFPSDLPVVPGCDMAGVVVDKDVDVTKFDVGAEVYGNIQNFNAKEKLKQLGTLAEYIVVVENLVAMKPINLSFEEAASLPLALQTALEGFKTADFKEGQTIFSVGGAGGVGTLVVQLAKYIYGASEVLATTSTPKVEFVKSLGADKELLMRCTLDSIFKVGFGVHLNCLEGSNKEGSAFIKAFDDSNELVYWRYPDLFWRVKRFLNIGSEATLKNNIKVVDDFVYGVIKNKRSLLSTQPADSYEKEDILSRFLIASKDDPANMNNKYLRDIILSFIIAGKDSTANTLSWFFYMLCKHPLIQEKIVHEIGQVMQYSGTNIDDFAMNITDTILDKMHYLHAALTETLRLYPAVPVDGRCADIDDVLPDGYRLKKGDGLYYMAYSMGRMTYIWGEDAEEFRPERWLHDGVFQPESPFKFVAFHAGPRICLGKDFAYRQMKIVAMLLLHSFRFKLADEKRRVTYRTMLTLHIDGGLYLIALPRLSSVDFST